MGTERDVVGGDKPCLGTLGSSGWWGPYPLGHHGGDGAADLVVADVGAVGAQHHEEEAHGQGHVEDGVHCHRVPQAHEGQRRLLQEGCAAWGGDGMGSGRVLERGRGAQGDGERSLGTWGRGDVGVWGCWEMGTWGCRDTVTWRQGDTETRGCGGTKGLGQGAQTWGHRDIGA